MGPRDDPDRTPFGCGTHPVEDDRHEPNRMEPPRRRVARAPRPADGPGDRGGPRLVSVVDRPRPGWPRAGRSPSRAPYLRQPPSPPRSAPRSPRLRRRSHDRADASPSPRSRPRRPGRPVPGAGGGQGRGPRPRARAGPARRRQGPGHLRPEGRPSYKLRVYDLPDRPGVELYPVVDMVGHVHRPTGIDPAKYPIRIVFRPRTSRTWRAAGIGWSRRSSTSKTPTRRSRSSWPRTSRLM